MERLSREEILPVLRTLLTTDGKGRFAKAEALRALLRTLGAGDNAQLEELIREAVR